MGQNDDVILQYLVRFQNVHGLPSCGTCGEGVLSEDRADGKVEARSR